MHPLLVRQIRRHWPAEQDVPPGLEALLEAVSTAYEAADADRRMLEHSMEVTSEELLELNRALRDELEQRRRTEERYRTLIEASAQIIWCAEPDGRFEESASWYAFTGQKADARLERGWLDAVHPEDRGATAIAWQEALATGQPLQMEHRLLRRDGEYRHMSVRAVPVRDEVGGIREWIGVHTDVTSERRLFEVQRFLAEAGVTLASSLDYEQTIRQVAETAVPRIADWCIVALIEGGVARHVVAHADPEAVHRLELLLERYPPDYDDASLPTVQAMRTGEPQLLPTIPDELLESVAQDEEHLRLLRELSFSSAVVVPLESRGGVAGALTLATADHRRALGPLEVMVATEFARRAGMAIENSRLYRQVEEAREQLEQQTVELESQAEELQQQTEELELARDRLEMQVRETERARSEAETANQAKSAFLASMSHELRTPLNAIGGYVELMELGLRGPVTPEQVEDLAKIRRNQEHLLALINDILSFAKLEAAQLQYDIRPVALNPTLAALQDLISPQMQAKELLYRYEATADEVVVLADRERLEQIVVNLLTNALKYTQPGGEVAMRSRCADGFACVDVADTGIGIPPERLQDIFEPFVQIRNQVSKADGVGLGLAISRELARSMGGDLRVTSELGRGSVFTLLLPLSPDPDAATLAAGSETAPAHDAAGRTSSPSSPTATL